MIDCDKEFHDILSALPVKIAQIPTILDYYDSYDAESLTQKIRSIEAFKGILAPMQKIDSGYILISVVAISKKIFLLDC